VERRSKIVTVEEKRTHVENILAATGLFDDLSDLDEDILNYRPNEDKWTEMLKYSSLKLSDALQTIRFIRKLTYDEILSVVKIGIQSREISWETSLRESLSEGDTLGGKARFSSACISFGGTISLLQGY